VLTTDPRGAVVPKQFCSLVGTRSLLDQTVELVQSVVSSERIVLVVAAAHERFWKGQLPPGLERRNVVGQPSDVGAATGRMIGLAGVLWRDSAAVVATMATDRYVRCESVVRGAVHGALDAAAHDESVTPLGITPDGPVTEYGWIVPEPGGKSLGRRRVVRFV